MQGSLGAPTCNTENPHPLSLLVKWKEITHALIACGHAAELYQELNSRTGGEDGADGYPSRLAYQCYEESSRGPAISNGSLLITNGAENNGVSCKFASRDEDTTASNLDGSDIDDIYDDLVVPSDLIDEAVGLSQRNCASQLLSFEEIFAHERSLARCNRGLTEFGDTPNCLDNDSMPMSGTLPTPLMLPSSELEHNQWLNPSPHAAPKPDLMLEAGRMDSVVEEPKAMPSQPTSSRRRKKEPTKARGLRVSDKRDLTHAEIPVVADLLVSKDAISYFLNNYGSIYEGWMPCSAQQPPACNSSIETSVMVALDTVQDLRKGNRICRLLLRFAYIHLSWVIDAYKAVAATDRVQGKVNRSVGQRDASVAITMYLKVKRKVSGEELKRSQLLAYCRTGRRWAILAGRSPIMVLLFPQIAETIVQNNSIADLTVQNIAVQIQHNHPELVRILVDVGNCAYLPGSSTAPSMPRPEDVAKTYKALGSFLHTIPQHSLNQTRKRQ